MCTNSIPGELLERGTRRVFAKDSHIFKIGDSITHCYYILSVTVKIYIDHKNGRRSVLDFVSGNNWVGELLYFVVRRMLKRTKYFKKLCA